MQRTFYKKEKPGKKPEPKPKQFIDKSGNKVWKLNNNYHRVGKPAIEYRNGDTEWYINGIHHRTDGPAIDKHGIKSWCLNGKYHREDGPAYMAGNREFYYLNGKYYTKDNFYREIYLRGKITKEELFIHLL